MDPLHPRNALPLTDSEIEEIYRKTAHYAAGRTVKDFEMPVHHAAFWVLSLALIVFPLVFGFDNLILSIGVASALGCLILVLAMQLWGGAGRRRPVKIDPAEPAVLNAVVKEIADTPIKKSEVMLEQIREDFSSLKKSHGVIQELIATISEQEAADPEQTVVLLLQSRRQQAESANQQLEVLMQKLSAQEADVIAAVQPVKEVLARFESLRQISSNLEQISKAHDLVLRTDESINERSAELGLLKALSAEAFSQLRTLEQDIQARHNAIAEVSDLFSGDQAHIVQ